MDEQPGLAAQAARAARAARAIVREPSAEPRVRIGQRRVLALTHVCAVPYQQAALR
jgi:hypothetical protein